MRVNKQDLHQPNSLEQSQVNAYDRKMRLVSLRIVIAMLALLLLVISGLISLFVVEHPSAMGACNPAPLCMTPTIMNPTPTPTDANEPTPTPAATVAPTPTPTRKPAPTSAPTPTPTPIPAESPTPEEMLSPTPTTTSVVQTPTSSPTNLPTTKQDHAGPKPNQSGGEGSFPLIIAGTTIFFGLLLSLGLGLFLLRPMRSSSVAREPSSAPSSWSPTHVSDPNSFRPLQ
jgi:hypothetical protein